MTIGRPDQVLTINGTSPAITRGLQFFGLPSNDYLRFGSEGFKTSYYEPPVTNDQGNSIPNNQVRHAVGGLVSGYIYGKDRGLQIMNGREDPTDLLYGVPDINLNNQAVPRGAQIAGENGHLWAENLGQWIRETLCE